MGYEINVTNDRFLDDEDAEDWRLEPIDEPSETDHTILPLRTLPPDPYRSLGGFLNYAGWPDCERMMELDRALRSQARKHVDGADDSEEPAHPVESTGPQQRASAVQPAETGFDQQPDKSVRPAGISGADRLARIWAKELEGLNIRRL